MILLNYQCREKVYEKAVGYQKETVYLYLQSKRSKFRYFQSTMRSLCLICLMKCVIAFLSGRTISICIAPPLQQQFGYYTCNCRDKMNQSSQVLLLQAGSTVLFRDLLAISPSNCRKNLSILTQGKMLIRSPIETSFQGIIFILLDIFLLMLVQTDFGH